MNPQPTELARRSGSSPAVFVWQNRSYRPETLKSREKGIAGMTAA